MNCMGCHRCIHIDTGRNLSNSKSQEVMEPHELDRLYDVQQEGLGLKDSYKL